MIIFFQYFCLSEISYKISDDRKVFTVYGDLEPVTQQIVRDSRVHTLYQRVVITDGIIGISGSTFSECFSLENITISSTVTYIGSYAFSDCSLLKEVYCPNGVTKIGDGCFLRCKSLLYISLPSSMQNVGLFIFSDTESLISIDVRIKNVYSSIINNTLLVKDNNELIAAASAQTSLFIPKFIKMISKYCLYHYYNLQFIEFEPNSSLNTVCEYAFCSTRIKNITFPNGTKILEKNLFDSSTIIEANLPNSLISVDPNLFANSKSLKYVNLAPGCDALESDSSGIIYLKGKTSMIFIPPEITSMHIHKNTTLIGSRVLQSCSKLTDLSIDFDHPKWFVESNILYNKDPVVLEAAPGGITEAVVIENCTLLNNSAFDSAKIKSIKFLGDKVTIIGNSTFHCCYSLSSLEFPKYLRELGAWSLKYCAITSLTFPATMEIIRESFGANSRVEEINLSLCTRMTEICYDCFRYAANLANVYLPKTILTINKQAFIQLPNLEEIFIPASVSSIHTKAFFESGLKRITFEDGSNLTSIGSFCFASTNLEEIELPKSLSVLDENSFSGCSNLTKLEINPQSNLSTITPFIINSTKLEEIQISDYTSKIMECGFSGCLTLQRILVPAGSSDFSSALGCLYNSRKNVFVAFPPGLSNVTFIDSTTSIAGSAFFECVKLTDVLFGQSDIDEIGPSTFYGCTALTFISFPDSLEHLQPKCFSGCKKLYQVFFSPSCSIGTIGIQAFSKCSSLRYFDARNCSQLSFLEVEAFGGCSDLEAIFLPPNLESIKSKCFADCTSLRCVIFCPISYSHNYLGSDVFSGCDSSLRVWVTPLYTEEKFFNVAVTHVLDLDCHLATVLFTAQNTSSTSLYLFVSCLSQEDNTNTEGSH